MKFIDTFSKNPRILVLTCFSVFGFTLILAVIGFSAVMDARQNSDKLDLSLAFPNQQTNQNQSQFVANNLKSYEYKMNVVSILSDGRYLLEFPLNNISDSYYNTLKLENPFLYSLEGQSFEEQTSYYTVFYDPKTKNYSFTSNLLHNLLETDINSQKYWLYIKDKSLYFSKHNFSQETIIFLDTIGLRDNVERIFPNKDGSFWVAYQPISLQQSQPPLSLIRLDLKAKLQGRQDLKDYRAGDQIFEYVSKLDIKNKIQAKTASDLSLVSSYTVSQASDTQLLLSLRTSEGEVLVYWDLADNTFEVLKSYFFKINTRSKDSSTNCFALQKVCFRYEYFNNSLDIIDFNQTSDRAFSQSTKNSTKNSKSWSLQTIQPNIGLYEVKNENLKKTLALMNYESQKLIYLDPIDLKLYLWVLSKKIPLYQV